MLAADTHSARRSRRTPRVLAGLLSFAALVAPFGCATAPPAPPKPLAVAHEKKMAWMLQLEDQRLLKLPEPPPPPVVAPVKGQRPVPLPPPPESVPDLTKLATDADPRIRRRAAISMGRVGLSDAVPALTTLVADTDTDVRQAALFALGLIGDRTASTVVLPLLQDPSPLARGRAAEALGLMAAEDAAPAIAKMAAEYAASPAVSGMTPDDEQWPGPPEAEAFKLGLFALVRLRAYDSLAAAALRPDGQPVSTWWPVAYALQRIGDPRAIPALRQLTRVKGRYTPAFAARGLGRAKDSGAAEVLLPLLDPAAQPREVVGSTIIALRDLSLMAAGARLGALAADPDVDGTLRMEALTTIAAMKAIDQLPIVQDLITDDWPALRAAAIRAAAAIDPDTFTLILSGLEVDRHWVGRAALAEALGAQPAETALPRLMTLLNRRGQARGPARAAVARAAEGSGGRVDPLHAPEGSGLRDPRDRRRADRPDEACRRACGIARGLRRRPARRGLQRARGGRVGDGRVRRGRGRRRASGAGRQGLGGAGPGGGAAHEARSVRRSPVGDPAGAGLTDCSRTTIRS